MLTEKELKVMQKLKASLHPQLDQRSMWVYWYIPASAAMMGLAVWGIKHSASRLKRVSSCNPEPCLAESRWSFS
jgi:hypothetical protein